jgi:hypothetical protein
MTIAEAREKSKSLVAKIPRDMLIISILILASSASFVLGYLAGLDAGQGSGVAGGGEESPLVTASTTGQIVASKGGTKYYFLSCAGASRISDANKVWFASASAAEEAGYALATNCKEN